MATSDIWLVIGLSIVFTLEVLPGTRADPAGLPPIDTSGVFTAILATLARSGPLSRSKTYGSPDRYLLARPTEGATFRLFAGAEADLIRNIHGIAELEADELGYLLRRTAEIKRIG